MHDTINIGTTIDLENLLQSRILIQGNSGSGKSGVARNIIEKCFGKVPFIVWDVEGEYYTLKELSGDIIIIGGLYADVPLSMNLADKLPKFIIENQLSVVVDLSDFKMSERIKFTKIFFEALMDLQNPYWLPYFFVLEECQKLAGEQDKQESATAVKDLLSRGRKRGYCAIVLTQRISMLNKSVASECNNKFIGRTSLDIDMDRSARELGFNKKEQRLALRDLKTGHFYAYGTSIEPQHVHEVVINKPATSMPRGGYDTSYKPKKPTKELLSKISKLADLPSIAAKEAKDIKALQSQVQRLTKELNDKKTVKSDHSSVEFKQLEKTVEYLSGKLKLAQEFSNKLFDRSSDLFLDVQYLKKSIVTPGTLKKLEKTNGVSNDSEQARVIPAHLSQAEPIAPGRLSPGEEKILGACAAYHGGLARDQLTVITGYKRSSRDVYVQRLKQRGLIEQSGERLFVTTDGMNQLPRDFKPLPKGKELIKYWLEKLPAGEKRILEVVLQQYPKPVERDFISDQTGYMRSSRDVYIQRLKARQVIEIVGRGTVIAHEILFDGLKEKFYHDRQS